MQRCSRPKRHGTEHEEAENEFLKHELRRSIEIACLACEQVVDRRLGQFARVDSQLARKFFQPGCLLIIKADDNRLLL